MVNAPNFSGVSPATSPNFKGLSEVNTWLEGVNLQKVESVMVVYTPSTGWKATVTPVK